jgi:hypothetical protein
MDRHILFTHYIQTYNIPAIEALRSKYPHDLTYIINPWWTLSYNEYADVKLLIFHVITNLSPHELKIYLDLLIPANFYIDPIYSNIKPFSHPYQDYIDHALKNQKFESARFLEDIIQHSSEFK